MAEHVMASNMVEARIGQRFCFSNVFDVLCSTRPMDSRAVSQGCTKDVQGYGDREAGKQSPGFGLMIGWFAKKRMQM